MSERRPAGIPRPRRFARAVVAAGLTLAIVLLPALVAGSRIAAPPTVGEIERLGNALSATATASSATTPHTATSEAARLFFVSLLWPQPAELATDSAGRASQVSQARLAEVVFVLGLSLLLYVAVLLARGRVQALLGCGCLALLPPILHEGHVLRPEAPATAFSLLALVLVQCLVPPVLVLSHRGPWRRFVYLGGLSLCASAALGLAVATLPSIGECLLVPGIVLVLAALQLAARAVRLLRANGLDRLPIRSINRRLLPWTATSLLAPAVTLLLLLHTVAGSVDALPFTRSDVGLLPTGGTGRVAMLVLVATGAVAGALRTGLRFGRGGRVGADVVLLVYCGVHLATAVGEPAGNDLLPAAPALAIVGSEGLLAVLAVARWAITRGPGRFARRP